MRGKGQKVGENEVACFFVFYAFPKAGLDQKTMQHSTCFLYTKESF
jgi:hypothetical protein